MPLHYEQDLRCTHDYPEVDELKQKVRMLRARRNTLSFIGQLPSDIFDLIINHLATSWMEHWDPSNIRGGICIRKTWHALDMPWRGLMNTCTLIREQIISESRLWSYIDLDWCGPWFALCLRRAGSSPLSIIFDHGDRSRGYIPAVRFGNFNRLTAALSPRDTANNLGSSTLYQLAYIACERRPVKAYKDKHWIHLRAQLQHLNAINLSNANVTDIGVCQSLAYLVLDHCRFAHGNAGALFSWIANHAPRLRHLHVANVSVANSAGHPIPERKGLLPALQSLHVRGRPELVLAALRVLRNPHEELHITVDAWNSSLAKCRKLMYDSMLHMSEQPIRVVHLHTRVIPCYPLRDNNNLEHVATYHNSATLPRITYSDHRRDIADFAPILSNVRTLHVHGQAAAMALLKYAAANYSSAFIDMEELVVEGNTGDLASFYAWLNARPLTGGKFVRVTRSIKDVEDPWPWNDWVQEVLDREDE
jgi:hypothetical protein